MSRAMAGTEIPSSAHTSELESPLPANSGRMVAQRGLFQGPSVIPDDLYLRVTAGSAVKGRDTLVVNPNSAVTGDSYFGRFPASYWQRWTVVDEVAVEMTVTGSGRVTLVASDHDGKTRVLAAETVSDADAAVVTFSTKINTFLDGGFLWVDMTAGDAPLRVERLRWTVAAPDTVRPTAVVICTFNRADDCVATLGALAGDHDALAVVDSVYVVDQGNDTVESRAAFPDTEKALDGRLRYLRQPNLGGAGGFGRGMYEVTEVSRSEHANVLLMDDDVLLDPEIVVRLSAFANQTAQPTIVGGQMLRLLHPTHLYAGAEFADFAQLRPGMIIDGALDDVDLLEEEVDEDGLRTGKLPRGDKRVDSHYNAWWSCLIPTEVINRLGLPLPLFFQWDDVEYGYRARAQGIPTVTLPGAGLWHADFDWKDADKWNEYFAVRNSMVVSALHSETDPKRIARVLLSRVSRYLLSMQYGLAATVIKGAEDFLAGPSIFADGGAAAASEIRKMRAAYPDTVLHQPTDLPDVDVRNIPMIKAGPKPSRSRLVLLKRLAYSAMGKTVHPVGAVPASDSTWWHISQFGTAVVTDASQEGVRVRTRDSAKAKELAKWAMTVAKLIVSETPRLRGEYRGAVAEVVDKDNWKRLYGL